MGFADRLNRQSVTLEFGAVSLMEKFDPADLPKAENLRSFEAFLDETFSQIPWLRNIPSCWASAEPFAP